MFSLIKRGDKINRRFAEKSQQFSTQALCILPFLRSPEKLLDPDFSTARRRFDNGARDNNDSLTNALLAGVIELRGELDPRGGATVPRFRSSSFVPLMGDTLKLTVE